jgi:hypothetical protein
MPLSKFEEDFLLRLVRGEKLRLADREEDKARQKVRKLGLAEVVMKPRRWSVTAKGWAYYNRYYQ